MMYKGGKSKMANTYEEHLELKKNGWTHSKGGKSTMGKLFEKPKYFLGSLVGGIIGNKKAKQQIKDSEAQYKIDSANEQAVRDNRQTLTMSPEALKLKEGMSGDQVRQEQENIDTKVASATTAATRGGTRVSAFDAMNAGAQQQADLSKRMGEAKTKGLAFAGKERMDLTNIEEARSQADLARMAQKADYSREDIEDAQKNLAASNQQIYGGIDAGIGLAMSDRKLKDKIKKTGKSKDGVPTSEFEYKNDEDAPKGPGRYKGVIAQDLVGTEHADAVTKVDKNTLGVNYSKIDVSLGKLKGGKLKNKIKKNRDKKDFMSGGQPDVTPGKFSHKENPIDLVQNNEEGKREKIGEMTGGEAIVPPKNVTQIRAMIENKDGESLVNLMDKLLSKWDKEANENAEAREEFRKTKKTQKAKKGMNTVRIPMGKDWMGGRKRNSIFD